MPTFDVVSEVDLQEVRNAVDQASREAGTRFDFKGTDSTIELNGHEIVLESSTEDRLKALNQVLEEKLVRRQVSLKALDAGKRRRGLQGPGPPAHDHPGRHIRRARQAHQQDRQGHGPEGSHLTGAGRAGPSVGQEARRPSSSDQALKEQDLGIPLQFQNMRD